MQTKGKFYIWMNMASEKNHYWMQQAQNWTTNPHDATFFDSFDAASEEVRYAGAYGPGEVRVLQATRDLAAA